MWKYLTAEHFVRERKGYKYPQFDKTSIANVWIEFWWSFLQGLASAMYHADPDNEYILRKAFSHYIEEYHDDILEKEMENIRS